MPGQSADHWFTPIVPDHVRCSGTWAVSFLDNTTTGGGEHHATGYTALFHYVDGRWTPVDRWSQCDVAGRVPHAIYTDACQTD